MAARTNRTRFTLLALLSLEPMSGYDMRKFIETSIGHFWHESYGQIYPTLKRLDRDGLIEEVPAEERTHPRRTVYRLTSAGREELHRWLREPAAAPVLRNELLLKLFFGPELGPDENLRQIEGYRDGQRAVLASFRASLAALEAYQDSPYYPYWHSIGEGGVAITEARIEWCERTLERLRALAETG